MKKTLIFLVLIFIIVSGFSQHNMEGLKGYTLPQDVVNKARNDNKVRDSLYTIEVKKFNFAFKMDSILNNISTASSAYLWPDTTMLILQNDSSLAPNFIFAIGEYFNPNSNFFSIKQKKEKCVPIVFLDTLGFYCIYERVPALSLSVDTLVVQLKQWGDKQFYWEQTQNPWVMSDYGTDSLAYKGIFHDQGKLTSSRTGYITWKFPLDSTAVNDTLSSGLNYFRIPLNYYLGDLLYPPNTYYPLSVSISFVPGFSWAPNADTIQNFNRLRFISFEENGDNGGLGTFPSYTKNDWNCSYILYKNKFWNDSIYTPSYYFNKSYPFEHHWIDFILRIDQTGGVDRSSQGLNNVTNYPNPFSQTATISFSLATESNVVFEVYDVTGNLIEKRNEGRLKKGSHSFIFNGRELNAGLYFYVIKAGEESATGKMILSH